MLFAELLHLNHDIAFPSPTLTKADDGAAGMNGEMKERFSGVRLPLEDSRLKAAETRERPRTAQGRTAAGTGSGKPVRIRGGSERAAAVRDGATINAPRQQAGHAKVLDPTPGIGQEEIPHRNGASA